MRVPKISTEACGTFKHFRPWQNRQPDQHFQAHESCTDNFPDGGAEHLTQALAGIRTPANIYIYIYGFCLDGTKNKGNPKNAENKSKKTQKGELILGKRHAQSHAFHFFLMRPLRRFSRRSSYLMRSCAARASSCASERAIPRALYPSSN